MNESFNKIIDTVIAKKITKPQLLYTDSDGNTLWVKYLKTRERFQIIGKNAEGRLVNEEGIGILLRESGISIGKPISAKGRRIEKIRKHK